MVFDDFQRAFGEEVLVVGIIEALRREAEERCSISIKAWTVEKNSRECKSRSRTFVGVQLFALIGSKISTVTIVGSASWIYERNHPTGVTQGQ